VKAAVKMIGIKSRLLAVQIKLVNPALTLRRER
jgi:hypothetical protein